MYCSQAFLIRTWTEEEKIEIQNGCRFSIIISEQNINHPVYMEIELLFNDSLRNNSNVAKFKCLSTSKYQILNIHEGVFEYIPVVFGSDHFHLLNLTLYSTLTQLIVKPIQNIQDANPENQMLQYVASLHKSYSTFKNSIQRIKELETQLIQPLKRANETLKEFQQMMDVEMQQKLRKSHNVITSSQKNESGLKQQCQTTLLTPDLDTLRRSYMKSSFQISQSQYQQQQQQQDIQSVIYLGRLLATEFQILQENILIQWKKLQQQFLINNNIFIQCLKRESSMHFRQSFQKFIIKENINLIDHTHTQAPTIQKCELDAQECQNIRATFVGQNNSKLGPSHILDTKLLNELRDQFIIHERHYYITSLNRRQSSQFKDLIHKKQCTHMIVFVHGYQGHPLDMRLIENYMSLRFQNHIFMISISNQNNTEGDILKMGNSLANEILEFIEQWCPGNGLSKISFIGYSLGGLIIRAALPHLQLIGDKFHTFLSLGSPHLGYVHNGYKLIQFGLWILQKIKKSQCLQQLTMNDSSQSDQTLLMKLSKMNGLEFFKNIILLGSNQDHYVTNESSLILKMGNNQSDIHNILAHNILKNLGQNEIIRITVDYIFERGDMDTFLGRKAHVAILDSHFLLQYLVYNLKDYFR